MKIVKGYGIRAVAFLFLYPLTQALHALTQAQKDKTTIKIIIKAYCPCE